MNIKVIAINLFLLILFLLSLRLNNLLCIALIPVIAILGGVMQKYIIKQEGFDGAAMILVGILFAFKGNFILGIILLLVFGTIYRLCQRYDFFSKK